MHTSCNTWSLLTNLVISLPLQVQCGFGRVGTDFWAYRTAGVVPDMVTLAKSMGNGVPMGGVVVRPDIAAAFDNQGMEYFATCGELMPHCMQARNHELRNGVKALVTERRASDSCLLCTIKSWKDLR